MNLIPFYGEGISSNSYLLLSGEDAVLIDCAVSPTILKKTLAEQGASLRYVILTHGHFDHIETLDEIRELTGAEVLIHENDAEMLHDQFKNGYYYFFDGDFTAKEADRTVSDGEIITVGEIELKVIHTPGHSRGSICLECEDILLTGDTLFANNIGRSDLYGGDGATIMQSLKMIAGMRPELEVYAGHGPATTLEREIRCNYYIRDALDMLQED